jgi:bifunctional enzyme CysN/CysC/sulfate adenylyltransferase subunit 1
LRDALLARGEHAVLIDDAVIPDSALPAVVRALDLAGVMAISSRTLGAAILREIEGTANGAVLIDDGQDEEAVLKTFGPSRGLVR